MWYEEFEINELARESKSFIQFVKFIEKKDLKKYLERINIELKKNYNVKKIGRGMFGCFEFASLNLLAIYTYEHQNLKCFSECKEAIYLGYQGIGYLVLSYYIDFLIADFSNVISSLEWTKCYKYLEKECTDEIRSLEYSGDVDTFKNLDILDKISNAGEINNLEKLKKELEKSYQFNEEYEKYVQTFDRQLIDDVEWIADCNEIRSRGINEELGETEVTLHPEIGFYHSYYRCPECKKVHLAKIKTRGRYIYYKEKARDIFNLFTCSECKRFYASIDTSIGVQYETDLTLETYAIVSKKYSTLEYFLVCNSVAQKRCDKYIKKNSYC